MRACVRTRLCVLTCAHREVTRCCSVLQDGNVRLYSILGTTLKDEGKLLEAKGPVTDVAYSHDGAFLAVCDASKVVTVFSVADGYSVSGRAARLCPCAGQRRWPLPCCHWPGRSQDHVASSLSEPSGVGQGDTPCRLGARSLLARESGSWEGPRVAARPAVRSPGLPG